MKQHHQSFTVKESGLILDPMYPFVGASPDGVVTCICCGTRVLEIKYPYSCINKGLKEVNEVKSCFFLCNRSWKFGTVGQPPVFLSYPVTNEAV